MNLSEVISRVIDLSHKIREYYDIEYPKRYPTYPLVYVDIDEDDPPPPPEEKELRDFLATLSEETIYQLVLIMYLGRSYFGIDDLAGNHEALKGSFGDQEQTLAEMMAYKVILADQLSDGLEELRKHKINVDKLPLKKAKVRKR